MEELVSKLIEQGYGDDEILAIVQQLVESGDLPPEAMEEIQALLAQDTKDAEGMFGVQFNKGEEE